MSDAPERIYLDGDVEAGDGMFPRCFEDEKYASEPPVEYIRADLSQAAVETLEAKLAKAVDALQAFNSFDDLPVEAKRPDIFEIRVRMPILRTLAALKGQGDE